MAYRVIYKLVNKVNGKIYVGQTKNLKTRLKFHRLNSTKIDIPLYTDMLKYGMENFECEIIDRYSTQEEADEKELYWQLKLDTIIDSGKGYNLTYGDHHGKRSDYSLKKQMGINNHQYGKTAANALKVMNLDAGVIYKSVTECAMKEYKSLKPISKIAAVCRPNTKRFSYKKTRYAYLDENNNPIPKEFKKHPNPNHTTIINYETGKIYQSYSECAKDIGIPRRKLSNIINGKDTSIKLPLKKIYDYKHGKYC